MKIMQWRGELQFAKYTEMLALSATYIYLGVPTKEEGGGIPFINDDAEYSMVIPWDWKFEDRDILTTLAWWFSLLSLVMR